MKLCLITSPGPVSDEEALIAEMLHHKQVNLHIRKPQFSDDEYFQFLSRLPDQALEKSVLHSSYDLASKFKVYGIHLPEKNRLQVETNELNLPKGVRLVSSSFHSFDEIYSCDLDLEYGLLSPVFDSISKPDHVSGFDVDELLTNVPESKIPLFALGGIYRGNISRAKELGFQGIAVLGAIWNSKDPVQSFHQLMTKLALLSNNG